VCGVIRREVPTSPKFFSIIAEEIQRKHASSFRDDRDTGRADRREIS